MFFSVEMADLVLYCLQQLGVMLAVGAETIVLIAYVVSLRNGKAEETEIRFSKAVHRALLAGLALMVLSGIAITILHSALGQTDIIFAPVFLFKWALIIGLIAAYLSQKGKPFYNFLVEGAIGGTWYALFLIHILAPLTGWLNLIVLYVILASAFTLCWAAIVKLSGAKMPDKKTQPPPRVKSMPQPAVTPSVLKVEAPAPKPVAPAPLAPKAPMPAPAMPAQLSVPAPVAHTIPQTPPPKPTPKTDDPHRSFWLPAIHFMPKSQAEVDARSHVLPLASITKLS